MARDWSFCSGVIGCGYLVSSACKWSVLPYQSNARSVISEELFSSLIGWIDQRPRVGNFSWYSFWKERKPKKTETFFEVCLLSCYIDESQTKDMVFVPDCFRCKKSPCIMKSAKSANEIISNYWIGFLSVIKLRFELASEDIISFLERRDNHGSSCWKGGKRSPGVGGWVNALFASFSK